MKSGYCTAVNRAGTGNLAGISHRADSMLHLRHDQVKENQGWISRLRWR